MDKNKVAVEIFNKLADGYQEKFMNVDMYGETFDFFCNTVKNKNAEILELACGPGNITKYLLKKRLDFKILGTDLSKNMIELAKTNNPLAKFQLVDSRVLNQFEKSFDAIMCGFLLPYLSKEESIQLIHDSSKILNKKGVIYISTMEDDYANSGFTRGSSGDEIFMHYHQADYLTDALKENGFEILKLDRVKTEAQDGSITVDLIIIAQK